MPSSHRWLVVVAVSAWMVGCDSTPREPLRSLGDYCDSGSQCESGACEGSRCVARCGSDAECVGPGLTGTCGADGFCTEACDYGERESFDGVTVCLGGVETPCSTLDDSYCDVCNDRCPGQRCIAMEGCAPLSDVGEECAQDSDCRTNNCSLFAGVCRVPLETACDDTNCDICISNGSGWTYCSRECGSTFDAPDCPGGRCLGDTSINYFYCRPGCDGSCPGECDLTSDGSIRFCDEAFGTDWTTSSPPRPLLAPCRFSSQCAEGTCIDSPSCDSRSFDCLGSRGYCSIECGSDADCGAGGSCVVLACPAGVTENCGPRCLPTCDPDDFDACDDLGQAECRMLPGVSGGMQPVCDPRNSEGGYCRTAIHCASSTCSSENRCVASGGSPNGSSCSAATDCASNNCQAGTCRGTSLRGDPCSSDFDCSVGACVSGVCD